MRLKRFDSPLPAKFNVRPGDLVVLRGNAYVVKGWPFKYLSVLEVYADSVFGWVVDDRGDEDSDADYPYTKGYFKVYCELTVSYSDLIEVRRKL